MTDDTAYRPRNGWSSARQWRVVGLAAVIVVLIFLASALIGRGSGKADTAASAPAPPPGTFQPTAQQLKTFTVESITLRQFVSQEITEGKIAVNGDRSTPVFSPYSGRITRVIVGLGDHVKAGQPLASIEASEFVQAQGDLATALAQLKLARASETRKHALFDAKGGSMADWQQAQADLATAESSLSAVHNRLRILGYSSEAIDSLSADPRPSPATQILAPISGIIVDRQLGPGQYAQADAATPVFTIADLSSVWMIADVREADAGHIQPGQDVEVRVLAYPERSFSAHVMYVAPVIDANTHRLTVRAVIDNADGALKPEMFANFRILTSGVAQAPAVPEEAVVYEGDSAHVWLVQAGNSIAIRQIRIGRSNEGFVEVLEGLKPGDRVVTKGSLFIDRAAAG
jgi:cobalt-zinc-cadmium efflux system membrane fusion protein